MYKLIKNQATGEIKNQVQRLSDNAFIPFDPSNTDYIAYLSWLSEGNQPIPAEEQGA
jgi:hypothetical protein